MTHPRQLRFLSARRAAGVLMLAGMGVYCVTARADDALRLAAFGPFGVHIATPDVRTTWSPEIDPAAGGPERASIPLESVPEPATMALAGMGLVAVAKAFHKARAS